MILFRIKLSVVLIFLSLTLLLSLNAIGQDGKSRQEITRECRTLLKNSIKYIKAEQMDSAIIMLDSIMTIDDKNPDAYYFKGKILAQSGDTLEALELLSEGMEKATRSTRLKLLLAGLKIEKQMLDDAKSIIDGILAIKPNESKALYYKGNILMQQGDTASAVALYEKGLIQIQKKK